MVGDVVGGYVVKEALASGRSGLLFLAVHAETGHRAVVQRRLGEDDLHQFAAEAAQILGLVERPPVERRRSRAGLAVLLAVVDAGAPGAGYTEHTNTERLPDLPRPSVPRGRTALLALGALVLLGGALGALLMRGTARQTVTTNAVPVQTARVPPVKKVPEVMQEPPAPSGADASIAAANAPPVKGPEPEPRALRPKAAIADVADGPSYCDVADVDWKSGARADLNELLQRAAKHDEIVLWAAGEDQAISQGIAAATTRANCKAVEQRVHRFHQRVLALEPVAQPASP